MSCKAILERLEEIGEDPAALDAVLVTHEHSDHIAGLVALANRFAKKFKRRIPIYMTSRTAPTIEWNKCEPELREFQAGNSFAVGDFDVQSFTVPHDATDPVGYCLRTGGLKVGLVTDLGYIPDSVKHYASDADLLVLESNHDIEMLKVGPYPWSVKQRVMSRKGHLSNDIVGEFIAADFASRTRTLVLGHLSEHNNHPEIARVSARQELERRELDTQLVVAQPRLRTEVFEFD